MKTVKDAVFEFIGRPKFFDEGYSNKTRNEKKYESPQDTELETVYVFDGLDELFEEIVPEVEVFEF